MKIDVDDKVKITEGEKQNVIEYGDVLFTGSSETPDECGMTAVLTQEAKEPLYLNSFCFGYRLFDKKLYLPDFLKHLFRSSELRKQIRRTANGVTRFNVSKVKMLEVQIPLPPLEIQSEIVKILDNFAELTAELTAELEKRKKQYEYYRDMLLNGECEAEREAGGASSSTTRWVKLEQCCQILDNKRKPITKSAREAGNYPYYGANGIQDYVADYIFDGTFVLVGEDGSVVTPNGNPVVNWAEGKIWVNNHAHIIAEIDGVLLRYLFHYLQTVNVASLIHGNIPKLTGRDFRALEIPLPPLAEQERIVAILDRFDSLCNSLTEGLPAEIELRKKQYEYYRDKLLELKVDSGKLKVD